MNLLTMMIPRRREEVKKPVAKPAAKKAASSDSSDSEDEDEKKSAAAPAKPAPSSSSDSDSDSDDAGSKKKPAAAVPTPAKKKDESSDSDDSDSEMEDGTKSAPVANGKRKATEDAPAPPKKVKLANGDAAPAESNDEIKSIFVGQLSWNVDNEWLGQEFASCGEVVSATVQMDRNTGRSRGFGYVHFSTTDAVEKALEMNGKEIDGRPIKVDKSTPINKDASREKRAKTFGDETGPPSSTLFVGNLSFSANEDSVWEFFGDYGVKSVRLPTDRESGKPKGFGYVEFDDIENAKKAFEALSGQELDGRAVRLDYSQPRDSSGGGGRGAPRGGRGGRGRGAPNPRSGGIVPSDAGKKKITF
ncbi:RNA-binding domain-containing protein [Gymnopus androsaceus JB14]|uniref:RNA-binding domain-containing protein n=1 Tax=Gymnopus androsaceus JB14 TaxID=1447944 RepID=A0A6A4HWU2_9AGAR|nr:RNA-binding domain-containing protein [Gymnopus androsaceus JB14]